jgi:hypothetical protein
MGSITIITSLTITFKVQNIIIKRLYYCHIPKKKEIDAIESIVAFVISLILMTKLNVTTATTT